MVVVKGFNLFIWVCLKNAVGFESGRFWVLSKRLFEGNIGEYCVKKNALYRFKKIRFKTIEHFSD